MLQYRKVIDFTDGNIIKDKSFKELYNYLLSNGYKPKCLQTVNLSNPINFNDIEFDYMTLLHYDGIYRLFYKELENGKISNSFINKKASIQPIEEFFLRD